MKKIFKGYTSLVREMLGLPNDGSFLSFPDDLVTLILICGLIGLVRNIISVQFFVVTYFFSYLPDIMFTMFIFPIHLFLFPSALLHWQIRAMGYRNVQAITIFALSFHLQIVQLSIPFFDRLGFNFGMPWFYVIHPQSHTVMTPWWQNQLFMTPGIIVGWWITAYMVARVLRLRLEMRWLAVMITSLSTFLVISIPIYIVFPTFNTLFNRTFGLIAWHPEKYLYDSPTIFLHWGYGTYFTLTALFGLGYFIWWQRRERLANT